MHFLGQRSKELAGQASDGTAQVPTPVVIDKTARDDAAELDPEPGPQLRAVND